MISDTHRRSGKWLSKERRAERLRKQIETLSQMDNVVWRKAFACALGLLGILSAILFGIFVYAGQPVALHTALLSLASGLLLFFLFRYWTLVLWLALVVAVLALAIALFEGGSPELPDLPGARDEMPPPVEPRTNSGSLSLDGLDFSGESKNRDRRRISHAIAKRRARLELLLRRDG